MAIIGDGSRKLKNIFVPRMTGSANEDLARDVLNRPMAWGGNRLSKSAATAHQQSGLHPGSRPRTCSR